MDPPADSEPPIHSSSKSTQNNVAELERRLAELSAVGTSSNSNTIQQIGPPPSFQQVSQQPPPILYPQQQDQNVPSMSSNMCKKNALLVSFKLCCILFSLSIFVCCCGDVTMQVVLSSARKVQTG